LKRYRVIYANSMEYLEEQLTEMLEIGWLPAGGEPPHFYWSMSMYRKRRTENGEQETEAGRDCLEVKAS